MSLTGTIQKIAGNFSVLSAVLLVSSSLYAQEPDTAVVHKAMKKYAGEYAVITDYHQKLMLKYEDGELIATTKIRKERVLLGELSPSQHNYDYVYDYYFSQLSDFDAVAYVPQKNGTYKQNHKPIYRSSGSGDGISDAGAMVAEFTGLTKGSVIHLTATQEHHDLIAMPDFIAQDDYPIQHGEFEAEVPNWVDIKFVLKGENTQYIKQTKEERNGNTIYKFTVDNVPADKSFEHVPSFWYYVPHVVCYIASYRLPGQTKDSVILSDPDHLFKAQYKFIHNMNVKQDSNIRKVVEKITKGDVTQRQKAMHIYEWVQKNIHYLAFEIGLGGWVPREADTVFKKKYGDCKDMTSLIVSMGRMAGIETHFSWIGTTHLPYTFEETPILANCNHVIAAMKVDSAWVFVDGTHSELPFGTNRDDIQGKETMIAIDPKNYKIVTIPVAAADKNVTTLRTNIRLSEKNEQDVEGTFDQKMTGYAAWNTSFLLSYMTKEKEERERVVERMTSIGTNKYRLDKYDIKTSDDNKRDMTITGNFTIGGYASKVGKDLFINMNLRRNLEECYVDTSDRKAAWYNDYKNIARQTVTFEIPKGYKVTYLPKATSGKLGDAWSYKMSYKTEAGKIVLTKEYTMNTLKITPNHFVENNRAIKELEKQHKEAVVLTSK